MKIEEAMAQAKNLPGDNVQQDMAWLVCEVLGCDLSYLRTWPERELSAEQAVRVDQLYQRRLKGEPLAHVLGYQPFWSLTLEVSDKTLIPRQDTELLVEKAIELDLPEAAKALDLGTGTGAIALSLASEQPGWQVMGVDYSDEIVALATSNAERNRIENCSFLKSDWFSSLGGQRFDLIVSNPPYIDPLDPHLVEGDLRYESRTALVAEKEGYADIEQIIGRAAEHLSDGGWLMLEHGYAQGGRVRGLLSEAGFQLVNTFRDLADNERVSSGRYGDSD